MHLKRPRSRAGTAGAMGAAALLLGGCAQPAVNTPPEVPKVTGTAQETHWNVQGTSYTVPADTSVLFLEIHYQDAQGAWHVEPAQLLPDGSFTAANVPPGMSFWLRVYNGSENIDRFIWTNATSLDLGHDVLGRADTAFARNVETSIVVDATGLAPWGDFDELELLDANQGFSRAAANAYYAEGKPSLNDTAAPQLTWHWVTFPLSDAAKGDQFALTQTRTLSDEESGITFTSPVRTALIDPFTQADGSTTSVQATFSDAPAMEFPLHIKRSAFSALKTSVHPTWAQDSFFQHDSVRAQPLAAEHGPMLAFGPRVFGDVFLPSGLEDVNVTLVGHNPYPPEWLVHEFVMPFQVDVHAPKEDVTTGIDAEIGFISPTLPSATSPAEPLLSPARNPKVNGKDLFALQEGVGLTPTITWEAPAIGHATAYEVQIFSPEVLHEYGPRPETRLVLNPVAQFLVPGDVPQLAVPAEVLTPNTYYLLQIRARSEPKQDVRKAPFRRSLPSAWADVITHSFKP